jgi:hypothetical protein
MRHVMSRARTTLFCGIVLLGGVLAVGLTAAQTGGTQDKSLDTAVGRYRTFELPVGKFTYRLMFDTMNADYWLWFNGEWERPEPPKGGRPWKDVKAMPGRFQLLSQAPGELDLELYVLDTVTGRMWARSTRDRTVLLAAEAWREITLPKPLR